MAASRKLTTLTNDVPTTLYRITESILRDDPTLRAVVKAWQTWEGKPEDRTPPGSTRLPWVELTPRPTSERWYSPESQTGTLLIQIRARVEATCIDDVMNLWGAIRRALNGGGDNARRCDINARLQAAGAWKGFYLFTDPLYDTSADPGDEAAFEAVGAVQIEYRVLASS